MWDIIVLIAGISATLLLGISYVPQILKLHKDKTAGGISASFWYILDLSLLMLFILAIDSGQTSLIIAQGLNLLLALIVTGQVVYYKKRCKIMAIIVLIGASGSGKSTIGHMLEEEGIPQLISFTTREMRVGEQHGVDYYFVDKETVKSIDSELISEISEYNGNYYGLFTSEVLDKMNDYEDVYFIANSDGARQLVEMYPDDVKCFWLSINIDEMATRMKERGDIEENINSRIAHAMTTGELFGPEGLDYEIIDANGQIDIVFKQIKDKL